MMILGMKMETALGRRRRRRRMKMRMKRRKMMRRKG
jgi:hypothetical protein